MREYTQPSAQRWGDNMNRFTWRNILYTLLIQLAASGISLLLFRLEHAASGIAMVFVLDVLATTVLTGSSSLGCSSAIFSYLYINFFYTEPVRAFNIQVLGDFIMLIVFLITALVTGVTVSNLQRERRLAEENAAAARELVLLEKEQARDRQDMEREKMRSNMLRGLAHDLRTPLTALSGACGLLDDDYSKFTDEERHQLIHHMSQESLWLNNLVENILNMTRIEDGRLLLKKEPEVIDDVVLEAVSRVERLLREKSFSLSLPEEVLLAPMDARMIEQVIINLLENAVRHTPDGSSICLSVRKKDDSILLSVADNGEGVPDAEKEHIFDRFVSLDRRIIDGKQGMGLGLSICRSIVTAHGGSIWVEDNTPKGACFCFTLPIADDLPDMA